MQLDLTFQGYTYSVFNLVYETNVASCRIWDALGFKRIGRVKGAGNLRSHPDHLVDAIIYGRDLYQDDDFVSEERFDKIRFYLKNGKYPNGADRAEKSRLRSAATHYSLEPAKGDQPEKLMLKGKEVISDSQRQYEIAREVHHKSHGGINKTTATIAEIYHWVRIKETVSQVIRNCPECSEMNKNLVASRKAYDYPRFAVQPSQIPSSSTTPAPSTLVTAPVQSAPPAQQIPAQTHIHRNREESPSNQLQMEASRIHHPTPFIQEPQYHSFEMPVDPALMDGTQQPSLANLPPSPFLAAYPNNEMPRPDFTPPDMPPGADQLGNVGMTQDTQMSGMEPPHSGKEEIRRRLTRAQFKSQHHQ